MKIDQLYLYKFDALFEMQLLRVLVSAHGDKLLAFIREEGFLKPEFQVFVKAIKAVRSVTGKAPRSISAVAQWLHSYCHQQGKISVQTLELLDQLGIELEFTEVTDYDEVVKLASETIREIERRRIAEDVQVLCGDGESLKSIADRINNLESIGNTVDVSPVNTADNIEALLTTFSAIPDQGVCTMPTGIRDLDRALMGGINPGELIIAFGCTGDGKSRFMNGLSNVFLGRNMNVFWASNELEIAKQFPLHLAAALPINTSLLRNNPERCRRAADQYNALDRQQKRGTWAYRHFAPEKDTMRNVLESLLRAQDEDKREYHLLCLDYFLKLRHPSVGTGKDESSSNYKAIARSVEEFREFGQKEHKYVASVHQAKARAQPGDILNVGMGSESYKATYPADVIITLNPVKNGSNDLVIHTAKLRDAPLLENFVVKSAMKFGVLTQEQAGWIPEASRDLYVEDVSNDNSYDEF